MQNTIRRHVRHPSRQNAFFFFVFFDFRKLLFFFSQVIGKFSIRLVPDMTPKTVEEQVCKYLNELHKKRGSPNDIEWVHCLKIIDHQDVIWFVEGSGLINVSRSRNFVFRVKLLLRYVGSGSRVICFTVQSKGRTLETSASLYIHVGNLTLPYQLVWCQIVMFYIPTDTLPQFLWKLTIHLFS